MSDVIETTVMAMFYGAQLQGMMPKLHSQNFDGMELIRPLYCINEQDIINWTKYNSLEFIQCACRLTNRSEETSNEDSEVNVSKRKETKDMLRLVHRN